MGEAKRRRDRLGVSDERTQDEREAAYQDECWRIEKQSGDIALNRRRRLAMIPINAIPKKKRA